MADELNDHTLDPIEGDLDVGNTLMESEAHQNVSQPYGHVPLIDVKAYVPGITPIGTSNTHIELGKSEFSHPPIAAETYLKSDIFIFIVIVFVLVCFIWPLVWWYQYQKLRIDEDSIRHYLKDVEVRDMKVDRL